MWQPVHVMDFVSVGAFALASEIDVVCVVALWGREQSWVSIIMPPSAIMVLIADRVVGDG